MLLQSSFYSKENLFWQNLRSKWTFCKINHNVDQKVSQKKFDLNDDAQLDSAEFANMVEYDFDHFVNPHTIDYFHALDSNGDGVISKSEFSDDVLAIGKSSHSYSTKVAK